MHVHIIWKHLITVWIWWFVGPCALESPPVRPSWIRSVNSSWIKQPWMTWSQRMKVRIDNLPSILIYVCLSLVVFVLRLRNILSPYKNLAHQRCQNANVDNTIWGLLIKCDTLNGYLSCDIHVIFYCHLVNFLKIVRSWPPKNIFGLWWIDFDLGQKKFWS